MATIGWNNPLGGVWTDAADWSGTVVPGAGDTALIDLAGTYTITTTASVSVGDLILNAAGATVAGPIGAAATVDLRAGTLDLGGGLLSQPTLIGLGGVLADGSVSGAVIDSTTSVLALRNLNLSFLQPGSTYPPVTLGITVPLSIDLGGSADLISAPYFAALTLGTLTTTTIEAGTDLTIAGGTAGSIVQAGLLGIAGGTLDVQTLLENTGTIAIGAGGQLVLDYVYANDLTNTGTIRFADATGSIVVNTTLTTGALGAVGGAAGTLAVNAFLDNTAGTLTLGSIGTFGALRLGFGTLNGGTVIAAGAPVILGATTGYALGGGTLNDVAWYGPLTLQGGAGDWLKITNGLHVFGPSGGAGTVIVPNGSLWLPGSATIDGATIELGTTAGTGVLTGDTLTLGPGALVTGNAAIAVSGSLINQGTIAVTQSAVIESTAAGIPTADAVRNDGSILVSNGASLAIQGSVVSNTGLMDIGAGATLSVSGGFTNQGSVTLADAASVLALSLTATIGVAQLGAIQDSAGGQIVLDGVLGNDGGTLTFAPGGLFQNLRLGDFGGGGVIEGGTVIAAGGQPTLSVATLNNVAWLGDPVAVQGALTLAGSTTIRSAVGGAGSIDVGGGVLTLGAQRLDDTAISLGAGAVLTSAPFSGVLPTLAATASVTIDAAGSAAVAMPGSLVNQGLIDQVAGAVTIGATSVSNTGFGGIILGLPPVPGLFDNQGTFLAAGTAGVLVGDLTSFSNEGLIAVTGNQAVVVATGSFANTGTIDLSGGGTLTIAGTVAGDLGAIALDAGTLAITASGSLATTGTILGFGGTDRIIVSGATAQVYDAASSTVAFSNGVTLSFLGGAVPQFAAPGVLTVACFAAGTRIATPDGPRAVEALRLGDPVSLAAGGAEPIVWIGHRHIACDRHPRPQRVWPVEVAAHAFAPGQPARPLRLSPDHAVFAAGVLIPVHCLVNGTTIRQVPVPAIDYWHIELPRHAVLLAEGLAVESFLDTGGKADFAGGPVTALHPDFLGLTWEAEGCAPLVLRGPELEAVRRHLAARAADPPARLAATTT